MNAPLPIELEHSSSTEKCVLGETSIKNAESQSSVLSLSSVHLTEFRERLIYHRAHPEEKGISFTQLKANLVANRKQHGV
jgi:hypothetical protein